MRLFSVYKLLHRKKEDLSLYWVSPQNPNTTQLERAPTAQTINPQILDLEYWPRNNDLVIFLAICVALDIVVSRNRGAPLPPKKQ